MSLAARANTTLLIKLLAAAVTYGFSILLARVMTPEAFGQVAFFLNAALLLSVVGASGQQMALIRFIPTLTDANDRASLIRVAFRMAATRTMLVFIATVMLSALAKQFGTMAGFNLVDLVLSFSLVLAVGWSDFLSYLARGLNLMTLALIPKEVLWRSFSAIFVIVLFVSNGQVQAPYVLLLLLVVLVFLTFGQHLILVRLSDRSGTADAPSGWARTVGPFWLTSISNIFLTNADAITVGLFWARAVPVSISPRTGWRNCWHFPNQHQRRDRADAGWYLAKWRRRAAANINPRRRNQGGHSDADLWRCVDNFSTAGIAGIWP